MPILKGRRANGHPIALTLPPAPSVATSYTMAQSASSGTTGTADTLTISPVGGNWPSATITLAVSGVTAALANGSGGTLSGSVLSVPSGTTTSCTVTMTPSTAGTATISATNSAGLTNPGGLTYTVGSSGGGTPTTSVAFTRTNTSGSAASLGFKQRGVWFAKGEIPSGYIPSFSGGPAQFYRATFWSDGSLKRAVMVSRETSYTAGEARNLTLTATTGSYAQTGTGTLSGAVSGHDFKVTFSSVTQTDNTPSTIARGSGSFTASLSSHLSITTRVTKIAGGGVADVFTCWGMAQDDTSGTADSWLKVNWTISRFKNADGSTAFFKVGAEIANDWWSTSGGRLLGYNAILKDGATTLLTFSGVQHPCQSRWLMCINDGSALAGTVPIVGATTPTLHDTYDRTHWINTNLVPPVKLTTVPASTTTIPTYIPCGNMEHRAFIDGTGDYMGRGQLPSCDTDAILRQDATSYARSRVNALAGLGVPYHYRSNNTRTRPSESADVANTPISLVMAPKASSAYTFTADGMPAPVDAYADGRSGSSHMDGRVSTGGSSDTAQGGTGVWGTSGDASHAVAYSYFMALVEGDEWWIEATIDLAMNTAHQSVYGFHQGRGVLYAGESDYSSLSIPTTAWSGLLGQWQPDNSRSMAWPQLLIGHMVVVTSTDHTAFNYVKAITSHNGDYIAGSLQYMPADHVAGGVYTPVSQLGLKGLEVPFFFAVKSMCSHDNYLKTEDTRWKALGDHTFHYTAGVANAGRWYQLDEYKCMDRAHLGGWANGANPIHLPAEMPFLNITPTLTASSGVFSFQSAFFNSENSTVQPTNGDVVVFTALTQGSASGTIPAGATEGQVAYIRDLAGGPLSGNVFATNPTPSTFKLSSRADLGDVLTWTTSGDANMTWSPQQCGAYTVAQNPPYVPLANNFAVMAIAAIVMARRTANAQATSAMATAAATFAAPIDYSQYSQFALTP